MEQIADSPSVTTGASASGDRPGAVPTAQAGGASAQVETKSGRSRRRRGRRGRRGGGPVSPQPAIAAASPTRAESGASQPRPEAAAVQPGPPPQPAATTTASPSQGGKQAGGATPRSADRRRRAGAIAAIDLGTNNCRLLVARPDGGGGFSVIDAFSRIVRLGEGLNETGRLSDAAMDRAVEALSICADRLRKHQVSRFRAIATEACRRASNKDAFLERVESETGLTLDIIAAEEEARLAVAGCAPLLDPTAEHLLVFDIGGGSTELIWIDLSKASESKRKPLLLALAHGASRSDRARAAAAHIVDWVSIPLGVVTLGERFDRSMGVAPRFMAMNAHVTEMMTPFIDRIGAMEEERLQSLQVLGTSGTITTIAGVHLELDRYSRRDVDGLWIGAHAVDGVIERLVGMTDRERAAIPCVGEDRATHLMSGAAILRAILRAWPSQRLRVADRGLREGLLYGLVQDGASRGGRRGGRNGARPGGPDGKTAATTAGGQETNGSGASGPGDGGGGSRRGRRR